VSDKAEPEQRHSQAAEAQLISDPVARAEREAKNGLVQYDVGLKLIESFVYHSDRKFRLRPSIILQLHRAALDGLSSHAGNWRPAGVTIKGSKHEPPPAYMVPELVEDMCDYVNEKWDEATAVHLAAYIMWRLNWIHPFADGNGRTSRMTSYVVLCVRSGPVLPGTKTIPEQIAENRNPYFRALDTADAAQRDDKIDVSEMEGLIEAYLALQLTEAMKRATGRELT